MSAQRADIALAENLGWEYVGLTHRQHLKYRHPISRALVILSNTPSDHRAVKNGMADLRRNTP